MKLFISHSSEDRDIIIPLVHLLTDIGIPKEGHIFCSSFEGYQVPNGRDFVEYIREQLTMQDTAVLFLFSDSFCSSDMCRVEAGAAWALNTPRMLLTTPQFSHANIPRPFSSNMIVGKVDDPFVLNELKSFIEEGLKVPPVGFTLWEQDRKRFLQEIAKPAIGSHAESPSPPVKESTAVAGDQFIIKNLYGGLHIDN